jgi:hypothetical protein
MYTQSLGLPLLYGCPAPHTFPLSRVRQWAKRQHDGRRVAHGRRLFRFRGSGRFTGLVMPRFPQSGGVAPGFLF